MALALAAVVAVAVTALAVRSFQGVLSPEEHFQAGLRALEEGRPEDVDESIEGLGDGLDYEAQRKVLRAGALLRRDKPLAALEELSLVQPGGDIEQPALLIAGEALYKIGRLSDSERVFLKYDRRYPDDPRAYRWLAAIYYDLGAMSQAIERLERLSQLAPNDFSPCRLLGIIHSDFEQFALAIPQFEEALRRSPPETVRRTITRDLAQALIRELRYSDALVALKNAPGDAETLVRRSECLWNLGRHEEARRALDQAVRFEPEATSVLRWQALLLIDEGKHSEAEPVLRKLLAQDPHLLEARYQLAMVHQRLGRQDEYAAEMATLEQSRSLIDQLTELSREAMDRPYDAELRDKIAGVCDQLGRSELAASWRRMAQSLRQSSSQDKSAVGPDVSRLPGS